MLQIVTTQDVLDLVDGPCLIGPGNFAEGRQSPQRVLRRGRNGYQLEFVDRLVRCQPVAVQPQQFAQFGGVSSIGLLSGTVFGLDQDDPLAAKVPEHLDQPVVKPADFDNRPESTALLNSHASQHLKELYDFLRPGADLLAQDHITVCISQANRQLTGSWSTPR